MQSDSLSDETEMPGASPQSARVVSLKDTKTRPLAVHRMGHAPLFPKALLSGPLFLCIHKNFVTLAGNVKPLLRGVALEQFRLLSKAAGKWRGMRQNEKHGRAKHNSNDSLIFQQCFVHLHECSSLYLFMSFEQKRQAPACLSSSCILFLFGFVFVAANQIG